MRRAYAASGIQPGESGPRPRSTKARSSSRASDLRRQKVDERTLQVLLGHRDARSTLRYARLADEALVEVIRKPKK